jgi:hypothetical protein
MCELNGPFVAGFVAGEGHFAIRPNNAGQSWACAFYLTQREDNAALIRTVRDVTGCGEISRKAARATSRPQAVWKVESIRDCVRLARYLDAHPLLAKKAGEFRVWQRGVAVWAARSAGPERWPAMERLASELLAHRQPTYAADYTWVDITRPYLESFLAGLTTAEGAVFLDEQSKTIELAAVLTLASLVAEEEKLDAYPTHAQLLEAIPEVDGDIVALANPTDAPPPGVVGYYSDGQEHIAVVVLSRSGRRLFIDYAGDVLSTNVAGYYFDDIE